MTPLVPTVSAYDSAFEPALEPSAEWEAGIEASPDPVLLSRILQRAAVPEAEILEVHYCATRASASGPVAGATARIVFRAAPSRAESVARKWAKLVNVHGVTLARKVAGPTGSSPLPRFSEVLFSSTP